jgi:SAM-dependent methyltransferase
MSSVVEHYENLLADHYSWLFGGLKTNIAENKAFFETHMLTPCHSKIAIDLGAGSGFQSIPLAEMGFSVTAVDLSEKLLKELRSNSQGLEIKTIKDDFTRLTASLPPNAELCVCMGDTLTHQKSKEDIIKLFHDVHNLLEHRGKFVLTFRDLTHEFTDLDRFIPVRSDDHALFTCFLEYEPEFWVEAELANSGFQIDFSNVDRGMATIIASK